MTDSVPGSGLRFRWTNPPHSALCQRGTKGVCRIEFQHSGGRRGDTPPAPGTSCARAARPSPARSPPPGRPPRARRTPPGASSAPRGGSPGRGCRYCPIVSAATPAAARSRITATSSSICLPETHHEAGLGRDRRVDLPRAAQQGERAGIVRAGPNARVEARNRFEVVVEHGGIGGQDGLERARKRRRNRGSGLRRTGSAQPARHPRQFAPGRDPKPRRLFQGMDEPRNQRIPRVAAAAG